jgi:hypothetical protein
VPTYQITYVANGPADRSGLETEVEADVYRSGSKFIDFFKNEQIVLKVAASQVLQVKLLEKKPRSQ